MANENKKFSWSPEHPNGILVDMTADEIAQRNADLAAMPSDLDNALEDVRIKRNGLLAETDYLALSDQSLSTEMSTYRQALRDITNGVTTVEQANNVTWPTKP